MNKFINYSSSIIFLLLLIGCTPDVVITDNQPFFDLKAFFESELPKLNQARQVKKTITYDNRTDEKILATSNLNFEDELQIFINSDINRSAWVDKYDVDSTLNDLGQLSQISYTVNDPKLKTQLLEISFENNQATKITIENKTGSYLSSSSQQLFYESGKGYKIASNQSLILFSDQALKVEVNVED